MFQRVGAVAYKKDLGNTLALCEALNNPQNSFKTVHVAGTNGKGSTSHMLASIMQEAGYKTGLYTSPHLKDFTERIRVNGVTVRQLFVIDFLNRLYPILEELKPSFFEMSVAMAFDYFAQESVDIAVIEVGLGGRLDSTNVISPELSVITNIGWDHMDLLGDTLEKIAFEKAGIIKRNSPVVISQRQPEVATVFERKTELEDTSLCYAEDFYTVKFNENSTTELTAYWNDEFFFKTSHFPLGGDYQKWNLQGVLMATELLNELGFILPVPILKKGIENVIRNTQLKGRWQVLQVNPLVICDTGHNLDGLTQVVKQLMATPHQQLHIVFGVVKGKDYERILAILPKHANYYFCQATIPRAEEAETLATEAKKFGLSGVVIKDVNQAFDEAKRCASAGDLIFIGGSTFVVAELNNL